MGPLGWQESVFIFLLALLIFGPKKLPELGRNIGKALTEFRRVSGELRGTFDREMANIERETSGIKEEASKLTSDLHNSYYDNHQNSDDYGYSYDGYTYPDYGSESSGQAQLEGTASGESPAADTESHVGDQPSISLAQAEGTVAVGSEIEPAVVSTAESATESGHKQASA
jgi:sec-independent protein translocase protein TatA